MWDAFISHASEDKDTLVAPLASMLKELGAKVWYDEFELKAGDSLSKSIDKGLVNSRYGIVVLSPSFINKGWPDYELRSLISKEIGKDGIIIRRRPPEIRKASCNGIAGCRSHTASHVHGIPETVIHHTTGSKAGDSSTAFAGAQRSFFSGRRCT